MPTFIVDMKVELEASDRDEAEDIIVGLEEPGLFFTIVEVKELENA